MTIHLLQAYALLFRKSGMLFTCRWQPVRCTWWYQNLGSCCMGVLSLAKCSSCVLFRAVWLRQLWASAWVSSYAGLIIAASASLILMSLQSMAWEKFAGPHICHAAVNDEVKVFLGAVTRLCRHGEEKARWCYHCWDHMLVGDVTGLDTVVATQATLLKSIIIFSSFYANCWSDFQSIWAWSCWFLPGVRKAQKKKCQEMCNLITSSCKSVSGSSVGKCTCSSILTKEEVCWDPD